MATPVTARQSDLALVLARVSIDGIAHWLLRRHPKWGDWSLVGGHVEPDEVDDWMRAATREVDEELAPLRCGIDLMVEPLLDDSTHWGPVASRSAHGTPTHYSVRWYHMRFLGDAAECLRRLPPDDFALIPESEISHAQGVSDVARRLLEIVREHPLAAPFAGQFTRPPVPLLRASAN
jgi:8-oxo-dGTP pyrophosphatase MutT (NUDIX family)